MCRTVCPVLFTDVLFVVDLLSRDESELLRFVVVVVRTRRNRSRRRWSKKFVFVCDMIFEISEHETFFSSTSFLFEVKKMSCCGIWFRVSAHSKLVVID